MLLPLLVLWLVIGLVIGFIFSKILNLRGDEPMAGIVVSGIGAMLAGLTCNLYTGHGLTGWYTWSCGIAAVGGFFAAIVWHLIRSRFVSHDRVSMRRSY